MVPGLLRRGLRLGVVLVSGTVVLAAAQPAAAATLPSGFAETQVATGLAAPTAMAFAPDGRLFVAEQGGRLRVIKNGALLATPFLTVGVNSSGERGLLGVDVRPELRLQPVRLRLLHDRDRRRSTTASAASPRWATSLRRAARS